MGSFLCVSTHSMRSAIGCTTASGPCLDSAVCNSKGRWGGNVCIRDISRDSGYCIILRLSTGGRIRRVCIGISCLDWIGTKYDQLELDRKNSERSREVKVEWKWKSLTKSQDWSQIETVGISF